MSGIPKTKVTSEAGRLKLEAYISPEATVDNYIQVFNDILDQNGFKQRIDEDKI